MLKGTRGINRFGEDLLEKEIFSTLQNTKQTNYFAKDLPEKQTQNTEQENSLENNQTGNKDLNS